MQGTKRTAARRPTLTAHFYSAVAFGFAASLIAGIHAVSAADSGWRERFSSEQTARRVKEDPKPLPPITGPLFAVVSIGDQHVSFYGSEGLVAKAPVSTGMRGHATPTGVFSIVQKKRWHELNIYSSAPMPYMQRITWSGIAMHAGVLPGYPASHGCIRMPSGFAQRIFGATQIGQRVIVSPLDVTPAPIEHKNLPAPYLQPVESVAESGAKPADETGAVAENKTEQEQVLETVSLTAAPVEIKPRNPLEVAQAMKQAALDQAKAAATATRAAQQLAVTKATELRMANRKLDAAESALERANDKLAAASRKLEKAEGDEEAVAKATEAKTAAEAAVADAQKAADEARATKEKAEQELAAARQAALDAKEAGKSASQALAEAKRRLKPLSVFISRKTGRLYVRQDFAPIFDAPVSISDADRKIGTHVYVGMGTTEDGLGLKWMALSMPPEAEPKPKASSHRSKRSRDAKEEQTPEAPPAPPSPPETASGALDRVTIPEETMRRLAELSWVGTSLIISDNGISGETGETTDFIILTRSRAAAPN